MSFGLDLSHHQHPDAVPWERLAAQPGAFAICRASYGTLRDRQLVEHVRRARAHGVRVGLYHFFRISVPVAEQLAAFREQAEACGYAPGDICPWIDIELDPLPASSPAKVAPSWSPRAFELYVVLREQFGAAGVYITAADWAALGSPRWVKDAPLWVAHWTGAAQPSTPGGAPWTLWQYRVGPFAPLGIGGVFRGEGLIVDHNRAREPLPLCSRTPSEPALPVARGDAGAGDDGWNELRVRAMASLHERWGDLVGGVVREGLRDMSAAEDDAQGGRA